MTTRLHRGILASSQPSWLRALALFCLLLVAGSSTAQAAHIHGEWLPQGGKHASLPASASQGTGEEHCPLCVAMHSALPATMQLAPLPATQVFRALPTRTADAHRLRWSFALFSRPPPCSVTHARIG